MDRKFFDSYRPLPGGLLSYIGVYMLGIVGGLLGVDLTHILGKPCWVVVAAAVFCSQTVAGKH